MAIFGGHFFYKFLMAIMTTAGAKMVLDLQFTPVPSRKMIIWSLNWTFVVLLQWNEHGEPPFIDVIYSYWVRIF